MRQGSGPGVVIYFRIYTAGADSDFFTSDSAHGVILVSTYKKNTQLIGYYMPFSFAAFQCLSKI